MTGPLCLGDCREVLPTLETGSVRCCVTSPPYWGLRDYGHADQVGLEKTPEEYVEKLVAVFREVRRVLADDGTVWLNLGSSYMGGVPGQGGKTYKQITNVGSFFASGGSGPSPSLRRSRAPSCGSDDTEPQDLTGAGSSCSDLCDECLADFLSHREHIVGKHQPSEQSEPLPLPKDRGTERQDSASASPGALPLDVPASSTLESWLQRRGACSRCGNRASGLSVLRSSSADALEFSRMTWLDYTTRLKQKDMVPIPWMVAMALQADGWYLRSDIIWAKPNPMPESVTDRPTKSHEYLFLLSKSARYFYDAGAIREKSAWVDEEGFRIDSWGRRIVTKIDGNGETSRGGSGLPQQLGANVTDGCRNARSVWTIATQPTPDAHFATFPEALAARCILAGSAEGDTVLDPFFGSGTVGKVAERLGRKWIGIELNPAYVEIGKKKTAQRGLLMECPA